MGVGGTGQQNVIAAVFAAAQSRRSKELEMWCVGSTRMSSAIARRRGGESTVKASTKPGIRCTGEVGYAKAKNAVEAYTAVYIVKSVCQKG